MISDADAVRLAAAIYDPASQWDRRWVGGEPSGIYAGLKDNALVFRGSACLEDWMRDFRAFPIRHPLLGGVEKGFMEGLDEFYEDAVDSLSGPTDIVGHSLGAARACLFAGLMVARQKPLGKIVLFGCPRPGFKQLSDMLAPYPIDNYKNEGDVVTEVPIPLTPEMPYMHVRGQHIVNVPPTPDDIFDIFARHHIQLYERGVAAL